MPARPKPGVDWREIEVRFRNGETSNALSKCFDVSRQAIDLRAKRGGWRGKLEMKLPALRKSLRETIDTDWEPSGKWLSVVKETAIAERLQSPKNEADRRLASGRCSIENLARILTLVERGVPQTIAAKCLAIPRVTLDAWKKTDGSLQDLFDGAEAQAAMRRVLWLEEAGERGDSGSVRWLREHVEGSRGEFKKAEGAGKGPAAVNVTFNLSPPKPPEVMIEEGDRWAKGPAGSTTHTLPNHRVVKDD